MQKKIIFLKSKYYKKDNFYIDLRVNLGFYIDDDAFKSSEVYLCVALVIDNRYDDPWVIKVIRIYNHHINYSTFYNVRNRYETVHIGLYLLSLNKKYFEVPFKINWGDVSFSISNKN